MGSPPADSPEAVEQFIKQKEKLWNDTSVSTDQYEAADLEAYNKLRELNSDDFQKVYNSLSQSEIDDLENNLAPNKQGYQAGETKRYKDLYDLFDHSKNEDNKKYIDNYIDKKKKTDRPDFSQLPHSRPEIKGPYGDGKNLAKVILKVPRGAGQQLQMTIQDTQWTMQMDVDSLGYKYPADNPDFDKTLNGNELKKAEGKSYTGDILALVQQELTKRQSDYIKKHSDVKMSIDNMNDARYDALTKLLGIKDTLNTQLAVDYAPDKDFGPDADVKDAHSHFNKNKDQIIYEANPTHSYVKYEKIKGNDGKSYFQLTSTAEQFYFTALDTAMKDWDKEYKALLTKIGDETQKTDGDNKPPPKKTSGNNQQPPPKKTTPAPPAPSTPTAPAAPVTPTPTAQNTDFSDLFKGDLPNSSGSTTDGTGNTTTTAANGTDANSAGSDSSDPQTAIQDAINSIEQSGTQPAAATGGSSGSGSNQSDLLSSIAPLATSFIPSLIQGGSALAQSFLPRGAAGPGMGMGFGSGTAGQGFGGVSPQGAGGPSPYLADAQYMSPSQGATTGQQAAATGQSQAAPAPGQISTNNAAGAPPAGGNAPVNGNSEVDLKLSPDAPGQKVPAAVANAVHAEMNNPNGCNAISAYGSALGNLTPVTDPTPHTGDIVKWANASAIIVNQDGTPSMIVDGKPRSLNTAGGGSLGDFQGIFRPDCANQAAGTAATAPRLT
ncbi:MAG: hypothetical protein J2P18_02720 [Nocardia sp.]|nr:hypothetical protein [Nocardia sp.]